MRLLFNKNNSISAIEETLPRELQVAEILGVPSFIRIDEKRWCQASV